MEYLDPFSLDDHRVSSLFGVLLYSIAKGISVMCVHLFVRNDSPMTLLVLHLPNRSRANGITISRVKKIDVLPYTEFFVCYL